MLIAAIFAVLVGIAILGQPEAFKSMYAYYTDKPYMFAIFVLSVIPASLFIFKGFGKSSKGDNSSDKTV